MTYLTNSVHLWKRYHIADTGRSEARAERVQSGILLFLFESSMVHFGKGFLLINNQIIS